MNAPTTVFVRHGILSNHDKMSKLAVGIAKELSSVGHAHRPIDNVSYPWNKPVLGLGLELATHVCKTVAADEPFVLVGHSQGGLVARVAAVLLAGRARPDEPPRGSIRDLQMERAVRTIVPHRRGRLMGVVMVATPNAGAMTNGQLSLGLRTATAAARKLTKFFGYGNNMEDLTTDRLFSVFQKWDVAPSVRYLTISGSRVNRYNKASLDDLPGPLKMLGPRLDLPNDGLVEDSSVDLAQSTYLTELANIEVQHRHVRTYLNCTVADHSSVHQSPIVHRIIADAINRW